MKQFHSHIIPPAILRPLCATLIIVMLGSGLGACAKKSDSTPSFSAKFEILKAMKSRLSGFFFFILNTSLTTVLTTITMLLNVLYETLLM